MRISDRYQRLAPSPAESSAAREAGKARSVEGRASAARPAGAKTSASVLDVRVSDRAQELALGTARLDELKARIRDGSFVVDAHAIAARLVGEDAP